MKTFYRLLCLLALAFSAIPNLHAERVKVGSLYYELNNDGTCSVTYHIINNTSNYAYVSGRLVIPEKITYTSTDYVVTSIGELAFYSCSGMTSVSIPNSVTSIGDKAFYGCSGMTSISITSYSSLHTIGEYAFYGCSSLTDIGLPLSVSSIGKSAFERCIDLTKFSMNDIHASPYPSKLTAIADRTFYGCNNLKNVNNIQSVSSIGESAFEGCYNLEDITVPTGGNIIVIVPLPGEDPVEPEPNCPIPAVKSIGNLAFCNCQKLSTLPLPETLTAIGESAFSNSGLTSIAIPNSVTSIGNHAFRGCSGLTSIAIPNSVTSIGNYAFYGCSGLTSVSIGYLVTSIGNYAFQGCSGLTSVSIPTAVTSIGDNAFYGCNKLEKVIFNAINCTYCGSSQRPSFPSNLKEVSFGISVKAIPGYAFKGCNMLTSVSLPYFATSIGNYAFYGCSGLTSISIGNSVTTIGDYTFFKCSGLTSVPLPNSLISIGDYAFSGCCGLTFVSIPNDVTAIGKSAFYECSGLSTVAIGRSVTSIGDYAFSDCSNLTTMDIPLSLTSIGTNALKGCKKLVEYTANIGQTTATINVKHNGLIGFDLFCDNTKLNKGETKIKGLRPEYYYSFYAKRNVTIPLTDFSFKTNSLTIKSNTSATASSVEITPKYSIDCDVEEYWSDNTKAKGTRIETGLDPWKSYSYTYCVNGPNWWNNEKLTATTQKLTMSTLPGVALNSSTALLCSEVNLHEDEVNVGFEWRRYDAPETLPSSKVTCAIVDGKLTGALSGLNPTAYYNYRPYYTSNSGNTYYGEWITIFTGDAGVHFDPTVKTYSASMLDDFSAQLKGYALRGSDEIARQGFQYWSNWGSRAANDVTEVEVKGQKFTHTLTDLHPSTTYYYRTFVETAGGKFYGEEQSFTTPEVDGVEDITVDAAEVEIIGYYNLQGVYSAKPFEGLNIVVYSDGSTRKMILR